MTPDPKLDLVLERFVDVPPHLVWKAWTEPEHLMVWFCPKPWRVSECRIDLRPGGEFFTRMAGPEGEDVPNAGCFLAIEPGTRLVFTDALGPNYRPNGAGFMTAEVVIEPKDGGTLYRATAFHANAEACEQHQAMGFFEGWGTALDQLVAHAKTL
ncbi:MAG: polyketide cyclase [Deltaproteobacteria bacterium]|nr:MAG: polyketide cyclase [Deltaproteobacteria bacterium]